ncbi:MAG: hypothetical protein ACI857_002527 [Arenicella sp.]|jgi:hypothetical protein
MRNSLLIFFVLCQIQAFSQMDTYKYERELTGIADDWHKVVLPNDIFKSIAADQNDMRLYGITEAGDTVEAAYFIQVKSDEVTVVEKGFNILNTSRKNGGYYYTLQLDSDETINEISFDFALNNFDWRVQLEGSQNQLDWYSIERAYRLVSIDNNRMNYAYKSISFPESKYRYYRIFVPSEVDPGFFSARITHTTTIKGESRDFNILSQTITEDKTAKQTIIEFSLKEAVPVNSIKVLATDDFDYYRPISISYVRDSTKTEKGYIVNYRHPFEGVLSSIEENQFDIGNRTAKQFKIVIENNDNQPLNITEISVNGYVHELVARFTEDADYRLVYGNPSAPSPNYDIDHFKNSIPNELTPLTIGTEVALKKETVEADTGSFFENPIWLWGIMGVIIVILGYFTFKMMGSNKGQHEA